jgi:Ser/Thr protein kinase RdoA (MazF antagonist)
VGNVVHRKSRAPGTLHRELLRYLEERDFAAAPRFFGVDEQGREMVSYMEGSVPTGPQDYSDAQLIAAARLLRGLHDATTDFPGRGDFEVICHYDFCPSNCVFENELPVAVIDFDTAGSGPRLADLAYAVPTFLNLGHSEHTDSEQRRRFEVFTGAYGLPPAQLPELAAYLVADLSYKAHCAQIGELIGLRDWLITSRDWFLTHLFEAFVPTCSHWAQPLHPEPSCSDTTEAAAIDPRWAQMMEF